eukprot:3086906-Rhodomonas_salina.2
MGTPYPEPVNAFYPHRSTTPGVVRWTDSSGETPGPDVIVPNSYRFVFYLEPVDAFKFLRVSANPTTPATDRPRIWFDLSGFTNPAGLEDISMRRGCEVFFTLLQLHAARAGVSTRRPTDLFESSQWGFNVLTKHADGTTASTPIQQGQWQQHPALVLAGARGAGLPVPNGRKLFHVWIAARFLSPENLVYDVER